MANQREVGPQSIQQSQQVLVERGMVASPPPPARPAANATEPSSGSTGQVQSGGGSGKAQG